MAKTKPSSKQSQSDRKKSKKTRSGDRTSENPFSPTAAAPPPPESPETIHTTATSLLRESCDPESALKAVHHGLAAHPSNLPLLELAGEINVEIGEISTALQWFQKAVELDPQGAHEDNGGSGPEKFLWLAQLCENGGLEAIGWYDRAVAILRAWIGECESGRKSGMLVERGLKGKLCSALCAMAELYMTDLCMEPDAEEKCEKLVTEALLAVPDSAEALQTLASVRISQSRPEDARAALTRSYELWNDLEPDSPEVPPYATRMAISRLLMETEMYEMAFDVLERLQEEDDQVVDLWYLGGWCLYLLGERKREQEMKEGGEGAASAKGKEKAVEVKTKVEKMVDEDDDGIDSSDEDEEDDDEEDDWKTLWDASREWLNNCARLYQALDWEDDRLRDHVIELLGNINAVLGEEMEDEDEDGAGGAAEGWVDAESDTEVVMGDS